MSGGFPFFRVAGDPEQIGAQCAALFGDRIRACFAFYVELLAEIRAQDLARAVARERFLGELRDATAPFEQAIRARRPEVAREIDAMAQGAGLAPWQLYFVNARTELYGIAAQRSGASSLRTPTECTALFLRRERLLGENWDWHPRAEELAVVLEVAPSAGPRFVMLTEPGIVGKIGLNEHGLGVCLNILFADVPFEGVPVHVMLRAILESRDVAAAHERIAGFPRGTASNLLFADASGAFRNLELRGAELREVFADDPVILHTNHYVGEEARIRLSNPSSYARLRRGRELYREVEGAGVAGFQRLLADQEEGGFPICRAYQRGVSFLAGTVAGVVMELASRRLHVVRGQPSLGAAWQVFDCPR